MRKMLCPQCKIASFYVKNTNGERRLVYVTAEGEVVPKRPEESLEGFDLSEVYCLGCSWHGAPRRTKSSVCGSPFSDDAQRAGDTAGLDGIAHP